jgi:CIC family chloride channel protein
MRRGGHFYMVVAAMVTGLAGAFGAVAFRLMIRSVQAIAWGDGIGHVLEQGLLAEAEDPIANARAMAWYWKLAIPAMGGAIVGPLIYFFAREARGHGVPEVMKAVAMRGGVIRPRVVFVKAIASAMSIGTGGSVGREGPIIQIGSAAGSTLGQWLKLPVIQVRTLVACGAAAGISATFNAPIAGAIFAAEIIVGDFAVSAFTPIVISSVVATVVSRFFLGNHPAFQVPAFDIVSPFELFPYMVSGVFAGLVAVAFIRTLAFAEDSFEKVPLPEYTKAAVGGLAVGAIGISLPEVFGVGYNSISLALVGGLSAITMGMLVLAKIAATSITIGSGGSGGVFAPSLFLGAMTGGFLGSFIHQWFPDSTASSGAYALVTMGAVVAAATHAPISAIIIIFELTQTIDIIPALMASCVVSTLVAQLLFRDSIYTSKLRRQGIDIMEREDPNVLKALYVREVLDDKPEVISASANFQSLLDLVVRSSHSQFFVVDSENRLQGAISLREVRRLIYELDTLRHLVVASDLLEPERATLTEDDDLDTAMQLFSTTQVDELAVVDRERPWQLIGTVHEKDVVEARNREWLRRDVAGTLTTSVAVVGKGREANLGGGYVVQEVPIPAHVVGKTLSDLAIRERTGVHVLLLRTEEGPSGGEVRVPTASEALREGETMVVAGSREALERLRSL